MKFVALFRDSSANDFLDLCHRPCWGVGDGATYAQASAWGLAVVEPLA